MKDEPQWRSLRRVRTVDSTWQIKVENPGGLSNQAMFRAKSVAEHMGDTELPQAYTAIATSLAGTQHIALGMTRDEAIANARQIIRTMTGYSDDDLKIEIVGKEHSKTIEKPWWKRW